jgi:hypothetical protein
MRRDSFPLGIIDDVTAHKWREILLWYIFSRRGLVKIKPNAHLVVRLLFYKFHHLCFVLERLSLWTPTRGSALIAGNFHLAHHCDILQNWPFLSQLHRDVISRPGLLFNDAVSCQRYIMSNTGMICEWWIGGNSRGEFLGYSPDIWM